MFRKEQQRRFGSAHVIAIAALFFALGGGAYAAVQSLPTNSVGTKQIKRGAVTTPKLSKSFFKELQKMVKKFTPGPKVIGPAGPAGPPGPTGPSDTYIGGAAGGSLTESTSEIASISVPAGEYLIQAKTIIFNTNSNAAGSGSCFIGPSAKAASWDGGSTAFPAIPGVFSSGTISLAGADSFSTTTPIALFCRATSAGSALAVDDARVWATRVGAVHGLPVPID
jgi:hypothetical protein